MSLLIQSAVCLYIWIMSICLIARTIIDPVVFCALITWNEFNIRRMPKKLFIASHPRLDALLARLEKSNFLHATASFMAEFSEAQSFYVIAITSAVIYVHSQGAIFNGAVNYPSLILNQNITASIVFCAFLPVIIIQISLRRVSMDSLYSLIFSTTAVLLSGAASTSTDRIPSMEQIRTMFSKDNDVEECGGGPSLRALCEDPEYDSHSSHGSWSNTELKYVHAPSPYFIWASLAILCYLWYLKLFWRRLHPRGRSSFGGIVRKARLNKIPPKAMVKLLSRRFIPAVLLIATQVVLGVMMSWSLRDIIGEIIASYSQDYDRPWNLGQVIALLAWIPVLAKYLYTLICKICHSPFPKTRH